MSDYSMSIPIDFDRRSVNGSLLPAKGSVNTALIGTPRARYSADCEEATNHDFIAQITQFTFAGQPAWGLNPFVDVLRRIEAEIRDTHPDLFEHLGHVGALCCRLVRGSISAISNHSWGIAIDLTFDGRTDVVGDNMIQAGLPVIAPIFQRHGLYWGIAFRNEDAMHFEASQQLVRQWAKEGLVRGSSSMPGRRSLSFGDRGPEVEALQIALNRLLSPLEIESDGIFGRHTRNAVIEAHVRLGLPPRSYASPAFMKQLTN